MSEWISAPMDMQLSTTAMLGGQVPCGQSQSSSHCNKNIFHNRKEPVEHIKFTLVLWCHLMGLASPVQLHISQYVEKLQFSLFQISCSQGILNSSWLSWCLVLKLACLHASFTAYENFYKLSKMHCLLVLTFQFPIFRISEYRNPTIKHISTYTLISSSISTYVTDLFLVIHFT